MVSDDSKVSTADTATTEVQPAAPEMPKIELKMIIPLVVMLGSKYFIDMTKQESIDNVRVACVCSFVLVASVYFMLYKKIEGKTDTGDIWVPPKAVPSLFSAPTKVAQSLKFSQPSLVLAFKMLWLETAKYMFSIYLIPTEHSCRPNLPHSRRALTNSMRWLS